MLEPNTILQNRYLVLKQIGQGGMGAVYQAKDQRLNSLVALKETFFQDEGLLRAFEHEAQLLASLKHSALPKVIDHFDAFNPSQCKADCFKGLLAFRFICGKR
ncbi:MAG TPA: hypothetical protein VNO70_11065 [Blastocatellia bacterium]|nr:hypothetical protein [Blastocatellia bacterium]